MFKIRCSRIKNLMPAKNKKINSWTKTQLAILHEFLIQEKYGREKFFSNDFTKKGNECEETSLTLACKVLKLGFVKKNEKSFENEFLTGTPDVILKNEIIDIKTSWNIFTFPFFEEPDDYFWQMQGYLALTGLEKARVVYCLVDTPEHLILSEAYKRAYAKGTTAEEEQDIATKHHTFGDIPENEKVKVVEFGRDEEAIKLIYERVKEANKKIQSILK